MTGRLMIGTNVLSMKAEHTLLFTKLLFWVCKGGKKTTFQFVSAADLNCTRTVATQVNVNGTIQRFSWN